MTWVLRTGACWAYVFFSPLFFFPDASSERSNPSRITTGQRQPRADDGASSGSGSSKQPEREKKILIGPCRDAAMDFLAFLTTPALALVTPRLGLGERVEERQYDMCQEAESGRRRHGFLGSRRTTKERQPYPQPASGRLLAPRLSSRARGSRRPIPRGGRYLHKRRF